MSIRACVMTAPNEPLEFWTLDDPVVEEGGVMLETIASEVCGTDVHLHHGRLAGVPYPIIPGHVSVGRVTESRGVTVDALGEPLAVGDVVTFLDVHEVCNACYHCIVAHQPNRCPSRKVYGITYSVHDGPLGGWAERIYMKPGVRILKLTGGLDADDVIGGGCGLFTGFAAVDRAQVRLGDVVLVQGAGPVGLAAAAFAGIAGASQVLLIGAPDARLDLGVRLGVDATWNLDGTDARERAEAIRSLTGGRGPDVVIEAAGSPAAIREGLDLVRDGGRYVVAGHYTDAGEIPMNPHTDLNRKHIDLRGQWGTDFHHLARALRVFARHRDRLPFRDVIGARYSLEQAGQALDDVAALRVTKAIITPNG
ncbi:MAG: zinc-binding dehydrogenase [Gemmatimonadetes bacterium]|nr:zinc-binding dehydrogenase [Gemmatimonadota bacterium]